MKNKIKITHKSYEVPVEYKVKCIADVDDPFTVSNGKIYDCIAEVFTYPIGCKKEAFLSDLRVIDNTDEDYLYSNKAFEKIE